MKTYARIDSGVVAEFFSTDGDIAEMFHPELIWVDITDLSPQPVCGWTAVQANDAWTLAAPVIVPPTTAELAAAAISQRDALLAVASEATTGMSDAFIAGLLSEADTTTFKAYAAYQLALNKITTQAGYPGSIAWPTSP